MLLKRHILTTVAGPVVLERRQDTLHSYLFAPLHCVQCVICIPYLVGDCYVCVCVVSDGGCHGGSPVDLVGQVDLVG